MNRLREKKDPYVKSVEKLNYYNDNTQSEAFDALNNRTLFVYDKNNKLISTTDAEYHVMSNTYDVTGNVKTKEDGRTNTTYYGYDEFGRLTEVTAEVDEVLETTVYTYDLNGNMTSQRDAKLNKTVYEYNAANKLDKRYVDGQTSSENYIYNPDGSLYKKEDKKGIVTTYTYYADGNVESQTVGIDGKEGYVKIAYIYDGNGNQTKATETAINNGDESTIITDREYDELNRVKSKSEYDSLAAEANRVENKFKYDIAPEAADLPGITASLEGTIGEKSIVSKNDTEMTATLKVYDKAGRLKYVVSDGQTITYDYYDNGNRNSVLYPGGMKEEYDYYKDNLLKTLKNYKTVGGKETVIDQYEYTYDAAHNQDTKVEFVNGVNKGKTTYTYDELNRLETVLEPSGQFTEYKYDAAGNREKEKVSNNDVLKAESTYDYNEMNWLKTVTNLEYTEGGEKASIYTYNYDKNGNQTGMLIDGVATVTYQYDNLNRLTKTTKDGKDYKNSYNAEGLRVGKTDEAGTTVYLYESNKVVMELDADGNMLAKNVYGTNLVKRMIEDGTTLYYMYNGHSDVTALLDTEGNLVGSYYYDAWGNLLESSGEMKDKNSILYAGYQYDSETELYYLNARMYDPKVARFLQEDTYLGDAGDPLSLNLYTYCHNEPIMYVDITGYAYVLQQWSSIDLQIYARNNKTLNKKLESVFGRKDRIYYNVSDGVLLSYLISEDKAFVSEYTQYKYTDDKNRIYKYKLHKKPGWIFGGSKVVEVGLGFVPYLQKASNSITTSINFVGEKLFGVVGGSSQTTGKEFAKSIEDDVKDFGKSALAKQLDKYTDAFAGKVMDAIDYGKKLDDYVSNNKWKMEEVTFDLIEMADISLYGNDLNELSEREVFIHEYIIDHKEYFIENCAASNGAMYSLYKVDKGLKEEFNKNGWCGVKKRIDSEIYLLSQKLNNTNLSIQEKTKVMDGYKNALLYYDERLNYVEKALEIIYYGGTDDEGKYYKGYYNEKNLKNNGIYVY